MMPALAIDARGLSKRYRRGIFTASTLRDELAAAFSPRAAQAEDEHHFLALDDVSFTVPRGTICGILGRNGSGKTTLMKILAAITEPTSGEAHLYGRVSCLLEVGAGFDTELTGLDNIYLNGAILGMSRAEVTAKLDSIVAFADIGPVLDTQVKRYSSGMYTRLAFALAVHLESEILLLDEILAVGDIPFRDKCVATMKELAAQGRSILFVSHNMDLVRGVCDSALLLDKGRLLASGGTEAICERYLDMVRGDKPLPQP
ncbi:ABC transporter ATP-binding protein [Novosphingobium sp. KCTC 2891]|uniref:ABC transporter ATP-binding protein n=1 Tax=Novosphingobium sp. KCTC 2891 TaxID=2989730 RepID=UPI0022221914|nr:ABC transporter ATP-binding protein [Novosphingobium sp. KCTC 2891]MCW1382707.1 ABC transporter ATP-binding protein [Novosphingobium sp. KCTC 2891]